MINPKNIAVVSMTMLVCGIIFQSNSRFEDTHPTPYLLKYNQEFAPPYIPKNNPLTKEGVRLGQLLFYDSILSSNNQMSCGSCHIQSKAFTDGKRTAVGTYGDTIHRNTMTLVNLAWSKFFFWDGRSKSLERLIREPLTNEFEMDQDTVELIVELKSHKYYPGLFAKAFPAEEISMATVSKAMAQFMRTIVSMGLDPEAYFDAITDPSDKSFWKEGPVSERNTLQGSFIRLSEACNHCHGGNVYGGELMATNAIDEDTIMFKVPSLLNILKTAPYMHDGRFSTVKEVMEHYNQHLLQLGEVNPHLNLNFRQGLRQYDIDHAEELFELFEDPQILNNPEYSDPFNNGFDWSKE
jgi:cytochrome c peroxidase